MKFLLAGKNKKKRGRLFQRKPFLQIWRCCFFSENQATKPYFLAALGQELGFGKQVVVTS